MTSTIKAWIGGMLNIVCTNPLYYVPLQENSLSPSVTYAKRLGICQRAAPTIHVAFIRWAEDVNDVVRWSTRASTVLTSGWKSVRTHFCLLNQGSNFTLAHRFEASDFLVWPVSSRQKKSSSFNSSSSFNCWLWVSQISVNPTEYHPLNRRDKSSFFFKGF